MTPCCDDLTLLDVRLMARADAHAMAHGVAGVMLMQAAGDAVVRAIRARWGRRRTLVLCGPGNNGGDGYVVARGLAAAGWPVEVSALAPIEALSGDALHHALLWRDGLPGGAEQGGPAGRQPRALHDVDPAAFDLVVDAWFGAGLARPLPEECTDWLGRARAAGCIIVAVDLPSGLDGNTGRSLGAVQADLSVTFHRKKPAHVLMPGRAVCGDIVVADIGIPASADAMLAHEAGPLPRENAPALWSGAWPAMAAAGHKYHRGHLAVFGGARMVGAARLTARAAARIGAGLVTLQVPASVWPVYAAGVGSTMAHGLEDGSPEVLRAAWAEALTSGRWAAVAIGPGARAGLPGEPGSGVLADLVLTALSTPSVQALVLDADALTAFEHAPDRLFEAIHGALRPVVLTPHEGEFRRLFGTVPDEAASGDKISQTRAAAVRSGAVVLFKGADTVVASPDGRASVNTVAPPALATGGTGDVLTGLIAGLLAQGMPAWEAASAASWVHGMAACLHGPGLVADDLPEAVPAVLSRLIGGSWR